LVLFFKKKKNSDFSSFLLIIIDWDVEFIPILLVIYMIMLLVVFLRTRIITN
jgi:hypothetical protein